jgi:hypothetical protein
MQADSLINNLICISSHESFYTYPIFLLYNSKIHIITIIIIYLFTHDFDCQQPINHPQASSNH